MNHDDLPSSEVPESLRAQIPSPPREAIPPMPDFLDVRQKTETPTLSYWLGAATIAAAACIAFSLFPSPVAPAPPSLSEDAGNDIRDLAMAGWAEREKPESLPAW